MYRVETVDAWIRIKPLLLDKMKVVTKVCCDNKSIESVCMNIEDYLLNNPDDIFIAIWIDAKDIAAYSILLKHDDLCCISQIWCKSGFFFHLFDYIPVVVNFAAGDAIYWDSQREPSNRFLKRFKFKRKYTRYELGDTQDE